jgi:adenine-specific DNA glycosylase
MLSPAAAATKPQAGDLLAWYDRHRRDLPWRAKGVERADPYRVWLSEVMLQQTTVAAVRPYFASFLARFPTLEALAVAPTEAVMQAWAGLGYYSRARNLHACAKAVMEEHGGRFPRTEAGCAASRGSAPTRPRRLPPSPSTSPRPRSTATWSGSWPACSSSKSRCRRRSRRSRP